MSKPQNYFWEEPLRRTLDSINKHAKKQQYSCVHQPLVNIKLENVVLDELHLMLRVTGSVVCS